ncbi:hypothetical protein DXC49_10410 [Bacteroides fragilis]|uniref:Uncharacterized protein n=2 Tax=Bacteroides fragilis TaxID=817 RepID=Q64YS1_BACFR|nr:hypothetical protein HMPREF0101_02538 [Bacteroides fragilis]BAD47355.1 hypothetical protein BF0606 [Bacteroides fragilis YCH46]RGL75620.1 hypothetical protein DXC49_10410 [Bacteroides fragilis]RHI15615.1 hypothetical protein DW176_18125 [Bacteroides fragilis]RHI28057.1 hypothetical protein DW170_19230 [Bacteroides fragilis]
MIFRGPQNPFFRTDADEVRKKRIHAIRAIISLTGIFRISRQQSKQYLFVLSPTTPGSQNRFFMLFRDSIRQGAKQTERYRKIL